MGRAVGAEPPHLRAAGRRARTRAERAAGVRFAPDDRGRGSLHPRDERHRDAALRPVRVLHPRRAHVAARGAIDRGVRQLRARHRRERRDRVRSRDRRGRRHHRARRRHVRRGRRRRTPRRVGFVAVRRRSDADRRRSARRCAFFRSIRTASPTVRRVRHAAPRRVRGVRHRPRPRRLWRQRRQCHRAPARCSPRRETVATAPLPADPVQGCGATALDNTHVLIVGGGRRAGEGARPHVLARIARRRRGSATCRSSPPRSPIYRADAALVVGNDAAGNSHVYRASPTGGARDPAEKSAQERALARGPADALYVVGGGAAGIESYRE